MELTTADQARTLAELEATVERGLMTFVEVGEALLEIRDRRLYRETHDSFEAYCRERWDWTRGRANQMIRASEVAGMLDTPVSTEAQARELVRLRAEPEAVREVWAEVRAEHGDDVTAADVRAAVDRRLDIIAPTERHAVVLQAIDGAQHLLDEPETEKALYALSRVKFWVYLDPADVAEAAAEPVQDAPGYAELAAWVGAIAESIQRRADGLRIVRPR